MKTIEEFLAEAPKTFLNKIHQNNINTNGGLIRNAQLLGDIKNWAFQVDRIQKCLHSLSSLQRQIILSIYASGPNGLSKQQIILFLPENERFLYRDTILNLNWSLLSYTTHSDDGERVHGFQELQSILFDLYPLSKPAASHRQHWLDNSMMAPFHFIALAAHVQTKTWKLSQSLEPHRRGLTQFENRLDFAHKVNSSLSKLETELLLEFGRDRDYLEYNQGEMHLSLHFSDSLIANNQFHQELLDWWLDKRNWSKAQLIAFLSRYTEAVNLKESFQDWWVLESTQYIPMLNKELDSIQWDDLPRSMKEAWLLGIIQISQAPNGLDAIQITPLQASINQDLEWSQVYSDQPAFSTPDFETVVGVQQQCYHLFTLECIANSTTDDRIMKFKLDKAQFLSALKSGVKLSDVEACIEWIQLPPTPQVSLNDWMNSFKEATFSKPLVLEVLSESTRNTLKGITGFSQHIIKELPQFGFIIHEDGQANAQHLLEQLGFQPSIEEPNSKFELTKFPKHKVTPAEVQVYYPSQEARNLDEIQMGELSQYGNSFKELHTPQVLRILKYGIICDLNIEVFWKKNSEEKGSLKALVHPKEFTSDQNTLIAVNEKTNDRIEIPVDLITNLKIQEGS